MLLSLIVDFTLNCVHQCYQTLVPKAHCLACFGCCPDLTSLMLMIAVQQKPKSTSCSIFFSFFSLRVKLVAISR